LESGEKMRMGKLGSVLPPEELKLRVRIIDLDELDGSALRRIAAFGQEDGAVF